MNLADVLRYRCILLRPALRGLAGVKRDETASIARVAPLPAPRTRGRRPA